MYAVVARKTRSRVERGPDQRERSPRPAATPKTNPMGSRKRKAK
jgi:hypothetical protein